MRLFLDTNVVLDLFADRKEFRREAYGLKAMGLYGDADLWVSAKSFTDVFYLMRRHGEFDSAIVQDIFLEHLGYLNVCTVGKDDIEASARAKWPDFEDCLVARCADKVKADMLITRDEKGFKLSSVAVCSPAAFFDRLEKEHGIVYDEVEW